MFFFFTGDQFVYMCTWEATVIAYLEIINLFTCFLRLPHHHLAPRSHINYNPLFGSFCFWAEHDEIVRVLASKHFNGNRFAEYFRVTFWTSRGRFQNKSQIRYERLCSSWSIILNIIEFWVTTSFFQRVYS